MILPPEKSQKSFLSRFIHRNHDKTCNYDMNIQYKILIVNFQWNPCHICIEKYTLTMFFGFILPLQPFSFFHPHQMNSLQISDFFWMHIQEIKKIAFSWQCQSNSLDSRCYCSEIWHWLQQALGIWLFLYVAREHPL